MFLLQSNVPYCMLLFKIRRPPHLEVFSLQVIQEYQNRQHSNGQQASIQDIPLLNILLSVRSLSNIEVAALTGFSDKAVGDWRTILSNAVAEWFLQNCQPLGGPGLIVEIDEAKFGKRKLPW